MTLRPNIAVALALLITAPSVWAQDGAANPFQASPDAEIGVEYELIATDPPPDPSTGASLPAFLRTMYADQPLPAVPRGYKVVTLPVSRETWLDLEWGGLVRVRGIKQDVTAVGADSAATLTADEVELLLVDNVKIYALPNFAPENDEPVPVCLLLTPDEARKVLAARDDDFSFELTAVARVPETASVVREQYAWRTDRGATEQQPDVATPDRHVELSAADRQTIELHDDESMRVTLPKRITTVKGFNPHVIDVASMSANELRVTAKDSGATQMLIVDEDDQTILVSVVIRNDTTELELLFAELYPDLDIDVVPIRDTLLLRGTVEDETQIQQLTEIAEQFAPRVLNQLQVGGTEDDSQTSSSKIPPGYRVVSVPLNPPLLKGVTEPGVVDIVDLAVVFQKDGREGERAERLLERVKVVGIDFDPYKSGGPTLAVSLLLRAEEVAAVQLAQSVGRIQLLPRPHMTALEDDRLRQDVVDLLQDASAEHDSKPDSRQRANRAITIGIGAAPEYLGGAQAGQYVDILSARPDREEVVAERVQLLGIVEPEGDDDERLVWVVVSPEVAERIESIENLAPLFVRPSPQNYGTPIGLPGPPHLLYGMPATAPPAQPYVGGPGSGTMPGGNSSSLADDIKALHEDVRTLIKLLQDRATDEGDETADPEAETTTPDETLSDDGRSILFFTAEWCGPCQQMQPIVDKLARDGLPIKPVDVSSSPQVARSHNIDAIPTFLFFHGQDEVDRLRGITTEEEIRAKHLKAADPFAAGAGYPAQLAWQRLGLELTPAAKEEVPQNYRGGMRITKVREVGPAAKAGLRVGDILVGLHVWETLSLDNVEFALRAIDDDEVNAPIKFYVIRDDETLYGRVDIAATAYAPAVRISSIWRPLAPATIEPPDAAAALN